MQTVPTLCATGCSIGIGALGYALGQPNLQTTSSPPPPQPRRELWLKPSPSMLPSTSPSPSPSPQRSNTNSLRYNARRDLDSSGTDGGPSSNAEFVANDTSLDMSPSHRARLTEDTPALLQTNGRASLKRGRSQLRRLSSITLSRSPSSIRPKSRSIAQSTDSTSPFIHPKQTTVTPGPNKLVKRSLSQHLSKPSQSSDSTNKAFTFRRPATSHQRAADLFNSPDETRSAPRPTISTNRGSRADSVKPFKHFFTLRVSKEGIVPSQDQRRFFHERALITRICPDGESEPTLLFPDSLPLGFDVITDDDVSQSHQNTFHGSSRPVTPSGIPEYFSSPIPATAQLSESETDRRPRRSFSISDLLTSSSPSWTRSRNVRDDQAKLKRRVGRKTIAPRFDSTPGSSNSGMSNGMERSSRRRQSSSSPHVPDMSSPLSDKTNVHVAQSSDVTALKGKQPHQSFDSRSGHRSRNASRATPSPSYSLSSLGQLHHSLRPSRSSVTPSEFTSSQLGSDLDTRLFSSGDEDEGDLRSDTVYDSLRTGNTRSSSGAVGPKLEALFAESIESRKNEHDRLSSHHNHDVGILPTLPGTSYPNSIDDEDDISTPVRTIVPDDRESYRASTTRFASGSPPFSKALSLGSLDWGTTANSASNAWSDGEDANWDEDSNEVSLQAQSGGKNAVANRMAASVPRINNAVANHTHAPNLAEYGTVNSLFDWSEQQPVDKTSVNRTPPRPKTVHGKKNIDVRGSRSTDRRVASGLHTRSHSVPVPDFETKPTTMANKFGTWTVGHKGVSEDWDEDFDVMDDDVHELDGIPIPESIRESQGKVIGGISALHDWTLCIAELKELRAKTTFLGIISSQSNKVFDEVDAMIALADQPGPDTLIEPEFDDRRDESQGQRSPWSLSTGGDGGGEPRPNESTDLNVVRSDLVKSDEPMQSASKAPTSPAGWNFTPTVQRPRKNSEAVAQAVIQAIHRQSSSDELVTAATADERRKVPFDGSTLKHIVPYVRGLIQKMKQILRDAEGLQTTPKRASNRSPPFSQAFIAPEPESPTASRERRKARDRGVRALHDEDENQETRLVNDMKTMAVV